MYLRIFTFAAVTHLAIAALFDVTVPNISYHFKKISESGELDAGAVVKDFLITAQSGARGTSDEKVKYYNLDAIISIDYLVNSFRATKFRIWATDAPRQQMLKRLDKKKTGILSSPDYR